MIVPETEWQERNLAICFVNNSKCINFQIKKPVILLIDLLLICFTLLRTFSVLAKINRKTKHLTYT